MLSCNFEYKVQYQLVFVPMIYKLIVLLYNVQNAQDHNFEIPTRTM